MIAPGAILDTIQNDFNNALLAYYPLLSVWGVRILSATTFLGFGIECVHAVRTRDSLRMLDSLLISLLRIGVVYLVFSNLMEWGSGVMDLGRQIGSGTSGIDPASMTPSGIYKVGSNIVNSAFGSLKWMLLMNPLPEVALAMVLKLVVWVAWVAASLIYLFVLIESVYVVVIGPIKVSFATLEYTWPMLMVWFERLLAVSVKLMGTLLTLGVAMQEAKNWQADFSSLGWWVNTAPSLYGVIALGEALLFAVALWLLPNVATWLVRMQISSGASWNDAGAWSLINIGKQTALTAARAARTAAKTALAAG
jgi:TrbL/VirB6 plasmid conjugal transfer protein